eukprot:jgi/Bigna1/75508/fgenesh1_pg.35_\
METRPERAKSNGTQVSLGQSTDYELEYSKTLDTPSLLKEDSNWREEPDADKSERNSRIEQENSIDSATNNSIHNPLMAASSPGLLSARVSAASLGAGIRRLSISTSSRAGLLQPNRSPKAARVTSFERGTCDKKEESGRQPLKQHPSSVQSILQPTAAHHRKRTSQSSNGQSNNTQSVMKSDENLPSLENHGSSHTGAAAAGRGSSSTNLAFTRLSISAPRKRGSSPDARYTSETTNNTDFSFFGMSPKPRPTPYPSSKAAGAARSRGGRKIFRIGRTIRIPSPTSDIVAPQHTGQSSEGKQTLYRKSRSSMSHSLASPVFSPPLFYASRRFSFTGASKGGGDTRSSGARNLYYRRYRHYRFKTNLAQELTLIRTAVRPSFLLDRRSKVSLATDPLLTHMESTLAAPNDAAIPSPPKAATPSLEEKNGAGGGGGRSGSRAIFVLDSEKRIRARGFREWVVSQNQRVFQAGFFLSGIIIATLLVLFSLDSSDSDDDEGGRGGRSTTIALLAAALLFVAVVAASTITSYRGFFWQGGGGGDEGQSSHAGSDAPPPSKSHYQHRHHLRHFDASRCYSPCCCCLKRGPTPSRKSVGARNDGGHCTSPYVSSGTAQRQSVFVFILAAFLQAIFVVSLYCCTDYPLSYILRQNADRLSSESELESSRSDRSILAAGSFLLPIVPSFFEIGLPLGAFTISVSTSVLAAAILFARERSATERAALLLFAAISSGMSGVFLWRQHALREVEFAYVQKQTEAKTVAEYTRSAIEKMRVKMKAEIVMTDCSWRASSI